MRIFVAGHRGMVGSAITRQLATSGHEVVTRSRDELDLLDQHAVHAALAEMRPSRVVVAAAKVGGINANNIYPADFIFQNLMIECNLIDASYHLGVERLLFLGSSCIYPRDAPQPMREDALLTGPLEPTNEPYAIAKIAGIKLCESYNRQHGMDCRSVMPTNLYGPGDNFHYENSHVIPALIRRFHEAVRNGKDSIDLWGSGKPRREFLHVDDMASASIHVFDLDPATYAAEVRPTQSHINVGTGTDVSIVELGELIAKVTGFVGEIRFDTSKPDGPPQKLLDVSLIERLGWKAAIDLESGLRSTYEWFLANEHSIRAT